MTLSDAMERYLDYAIGDTDLDGALAKQQLPHRYIDPQEFMHLGMRLHAHRNHQGIRHIATFFNCGIQRLIEESYDLGHTDSSYHVGLVFLKTTEIIDNLGRGIKDDRGEEDFRRVIALGTRGKSVLVLGENIFRDAHGVEVYLGGSATENFCSYSSDLKVTVTDGVGRFSFMGMTNSELHLKGYVDEDCLIDADGCKVFVERPGYSFGREAKYCEITSPHKGALREMTHLVGKGTKLYFQEPDGSTSLYFSK